jgi:hypothetical protein
MTGMQWVDWVILTAWIVVIHAAVRTLEVLVVGR